MFQHYKQKENIKNKEMKTTTMRESSQYITSSVNLSATIPL